LKEYNLGLDKENNEKYASFIEKFNKSHLCKVYIKYYLDNLEQN